MPLATRPIGGSRLTRAIALLVVAAFALGGCRFDGAYDLPLPGHPVSKDHSYVVTADFADVLNVVPRSTVMVDDVVVGEVTDVERVGWHARVTMRIKDTVNLPDNAIAEIKQVSLLGEKYVALERPTDAPPQGHLGNGDNIPLSATGRNPEVEEVLGALSFLLSGGGVAQLGTITREANNIMDGRTQRLRGTLESLTRVVRTVDGQKKQIVGAMSSLNSLSKTLNGEKTTIADALDATGPAIRVLDSQHDEMIRMLASLKRLGAVGTRVINRSKGNVLKILKEVDPILNRIADSGQSLAPGLNLLASFPFPKAANDIVKGDYANTIARVQIDFSNLYTDLKLPDIQLGKAATGKAAVGRCVHSGRLLSVNCTAVLTSPGLIRSLQTACHAKSEATNSVCLPVRAIPAVALGRMVGSGTDVLRADFSGITGLTRALVDPRPGHVGTMGTLIGGDA